MFSTLKEEHKLRQSVQRGTAGQGGLPSFSFVVNVFSSNSADQKTRKVFLPMGRPP